LEAQTETGGDGSLRPKQPVQQHRLAQFFEGEQFAKVAKDVCSAPGTRCVAFAAPPSHVLKIPAGLPETTA
jgi:hypothetical protein